MDLPRATDLPFFAYGLFRHGQLGFLRLRGFVDRSDDAQVKGNLLERDGLPILDPESNLTAEGSLYWFKNGAEAYRSVTELEPGAQYFWDVREARTARETVRANVLIGKSSQKGSVYLDEPWDGRKDPLFNAGLDVVREVLKANGEFEWSQKPLFRLEMAYLLLWAAIERYASLRHLIGGGPVERIRKVAEAPSFASALKRVVQPRGGKREVFRVDQPKESYRLDPKDPAESMDFYYQIRNNATHRGKAASSDFDLIHDSLGQLLSIFEIVLSEAFDEAEKPFST